MSGPLHGRHIGRSWTGHPLEDECPCPKAPCGLAIADGDPNCPEHGIEAAKTLRQIHDAEQCPVPPPVFTRRDYLRTFGHDD